MIYKAAKILWRGFEKFLNKRSYDLRWKPEVFFENKNNELKLNFDLVASLLMTRKDQIFFVEIGANDGILNDPIHRYVRDFGWSGLVIEPLPDIFEILKKNYRAYPNVIPLNFAISASEKDQTLFTVRTDSTASAHAHQYSSFRREIVEKHTNFVPDIADRIEERTVACITFDTLLKRYVADRNIDVLQIDTEGYDYEILKMIDFQVTKPSIINYESCHLSRADKNASVRLLVNQGYRVAAGDLDTIAYHPSS